MFGNGPPRVVTSYETGDSAVAGRDTLRVGPAMELVSPDQYILEPAT